jgi:hypothetical protein
MLTKVEIQALDKSAIDLPTPLGPNRLNGRCWAEDDTGFHPDDALATGALDHLDFLPFVKAKEEAFYLSMSTTCLPLGSSSVWSRSMATSGRRRRSPMLRQARP